MKMQMKWPADFGPNHPRIEPGAVLSDDELERAHLDQRGGLHLVTSNYTEAAHAASEYDNDDEPAVQAMRPGDAVALCVLLLVSALCVGGFIVVAWDRLL